jgi:hypothetical protein
MLGIYDYYGLDIKVVHFQQDKATQHTSVIIKQRFSRYSSYADAIVDWPPQSPDLNPIEQV